MTLTGMKASSIDAVSKHWGVYENAQGKREFKRGLGGKRADSEIRRPGGDDFHRAEIGRVG